MGASATVRVLGAVLVALLLGSCATGPSIAECEGGRYWADCGGEGQDVLGCNVGTGECRMFFGGVVADGFVASDCTEALCCHAVPSGTRLWPFSSWHPGGAVLAQAREDIDLLRLTSIDRDSPAGLGVTFAPVEAATPSLGCSHEHGVFPGCRLASVTTSLSPTHLVVDVRSAIALRYHMSIVVERSPDGGASARVFMFEEPPDDIEDGPYCGASVGAAYTPTGSLVLDPDALDSASAAHGVLDADLAQPDGSYVTHITLRF